MANINYPLAGGGAYYLENGLFGIQPTSATTLEDWESGNHDNWPGGNQGFTVEQDGTLFGSYNLTETAGNFASLYSFPGDGLSEYWPRSDGRTLHYYSYVPAGASIATGMYFGAVDESNNYFTRKQAGGEMQLVEKVGGSNTIINSVTPPVPDDTVLRYELDWYDGSGSRTVGDMDLAVYNNSDDSLIGDLSANSTAVETNTGSNGEGLGIWKSGDAGWRHDDVKLVG